MTHHPANWYPDPTERHELRYWDGTAWTSHVVTGGRQSLSPFEPSPPAASADGDAAPMHQPSAGHPIADAEVDGPPEDGRALIEAAVKEWTGQLISLGGRNTLLYFRHLKAGTLDLVTANPSALAGLLDGKTVGLTSLFPDPSDREQAARRCRTIRSKANENLEERGLRTLSLGLGLAAWDNTRGTAAPAAPVLLRSLVLTPRGGAEEDFDFALIDEWEINPTLLHLLKTDYQIELSADDLEAVAVDSQGRLQQHALFQTLTKHCTSVTDWSIDASAAVVANFSYVKMPMVEDLEGSIDALVEHPLVCALAGSGEDRAKVRDGDAAYWTEIDAGFPDRQPPRDEFLVRDADASQCQVVNLAVRGANLVVQGPPGTGKSQTIANLIATLVAREKSVLFVAEKRAAIDAVLDRLREVELADLVLDLHEGTGNRRRLATDLGLSLQAVRSIPAPNDDQLHRELAERRDRLGEHDAAMNDPRDPWGASVFELQSELMVVADTERSELRFDGAVLRRLDRETLERAAQALKEWASIGGSDVASGLRPWSHALGKVTTGTQVQDLRAAVGTLCRSTLPAVMARLDAAISDARFRPPTTVDEWCRMLDLFAAVAQTLDGFDDAVFVAALPELVAALEPASRGSFTRFRSRLFSSGYRSARKKARMLDRAGRKVPALRESLERARDQHAAWTAWAAQVGAPHRVAVASDAASTTSQARAELAGVGEWISADLTVDADFEGVDRRIQALEHDDSTLTRLPRLEELRRDLRELGLEGVVGEVSARGLDADRADRVLRFVWAASILQTITAEDSRIGAFDGRYHSNVESEFVARDVAHCQLNAQRVRRKVAERAIAMRNEHEDQSDVVEKNAKRKRKHAGVRELMQIAPDVLLALRPCWVMSPLVVSQLLPSDKPYFDVVVFDEASQIRPADAIPALARGRQAIVAGDSKQLPPTIFFDAGPVDGGGDDGGGAVTKDLESILDAMSVLLPGGRGGTMLNWHYRSRDERLIAFSNVQSELYNGSLTTFPGALGEGCLQHVEIPHRPGVGGTVESSTDEVAKVVELVREHARLRPHESLGVIAMGRKHADRIEESLRLARPDDLALDDYLDEGNREAFFVKNLERVQGDERDAIVLTIGYPKTPDGRMQYRFGPLNNDGGERRLNVAITRAKSRMTVVSSFGPNDMDDSRLYKAGAQMLKRYLAYARSGGTDLGRDFTLKPGLNGFEVDVMNRLTAAGVPVEAQYGVAGYWIDFAAKHPVRRGEMVLAIEADGATYHSSETARQRDRLRRSHLENLGWEFCRIWSTDWFRDPETQVQRVVDAYAAAVAASDARHDGDHGDAGGSLAAPPPPPPPPSPPATTVLRSGTRPRVRPGQSIDAYSDRDLFALCFWIRSDTLLRTDAELLEEMMRELGFQRRGRKIVERLNLVIAATR